MGETAFRRVSWKACSQERHKPENVVNSQAQARHPSRINPENIRPSFGKDENHMFYDKVEATLGLTSS